MKILAWLFLFFNFSIAQVPWSVDDSLSDSFVGPFPDWINVMDYGAKGDGISDDTQAFVSALAVRTEVLTIWVPAGTYMITGLDLFGGQQIGIIGENPLNTTIRMNPISNRCVNRNNWNDGNCAMFWNDGASFLTFSRITWDGSNVVHTVFWQEWMYHGGYSGRGLMSDLVITNSIFGIRAANMSGCANGNCASAEWHVTRCVFENIQFGFSTEGGNAVDWLFLWNQFIGCTIGLTNQWGEGNFHSIGNAFYNSSTADIVIQCNAIGIRDNFSYKSATFIQYNVQSCPQTSLIMNNTVVLATNSSRLIAAKAELALMLVDNTFVFEGKVSPPFVVNFLPWYQWITYVLSVGNKFVWSGASNFSTNSSVFYESNVGAAPYDLFHELDRTYIDSSKISTKAYNIPVMPSFQRRYYPTIIRPNITGGSEALQAAINQSLAFKGHRPVVWLEPGTWDITQKIVVPPMLDVQIIGVTSSNAFNTNAALNTIVAWGGDSLVNGSKPVMFEVQGPSKATFSNFQVVGPVDTAIIFHLIDVDTEGSRVYSEIFDMNLNQPGNAAFTVLMNNTDHIHFDAFSGFIAGIPSGVTFSHRGGPCLTQGKGSQVTGRAAIFSGAGGGGSSGGNYWEVKNNGRLYSGSTWMEQGNGWIQWDDSISGDFVYFNGQANNYWSITNSSCRAVIFGLAVADFAITPSVNTSVFLSGAISQSTSDQLYNQTYTQGDIAFDGVAWFNEALVPPIHAGNVPLNSTDWYLTMLSFLRTVHIPYPRTPDITTNVTDVRMYRVVASYYHIGLFIDGSQDLKTCIPSKIASNSNVNSSNQLSSSAMIIFLILAFTSLLVC